MLPRFSLIKQRTADIDSVLLNLSVGALDFSFTVSRKPLINDFEDNFYPGQNRRNLFAITFMVLVHALLLYFFLIQKSAPITEGKEDGKVVFLDLSNLKNSPTPKPAKSQPEKKQQQKSPPAQSKPTAATRPQVVSPPTVSPVAAPVYEDTMAQIAAARAKRQASQPATETSQAQPESSGQSENDIAMARIKANIAGAVYSKKGTNGVFQILHKGVQTGRFSFRGWTNSPNDSYRQTFEVDAGIGGNVELAMVRKMIDLIREHYKGDFNWESQRLGRVVVMSARPADTAQLETFLMREMFEKK